MVWLHLRIRKPFWDVMKSGYVPDTVYLIFKLPYDVELEIELNIKEAKKLKKLLEKVIE